MSEAAKLINREDSLLVVIDAQERLMPVINDKESVTSNIKRLAAFAQIIDLPVIYTEQDKLGPTLSEIAEAGGGDIAAIPKITFDCFGCEEFVAKLQELDKTNLLLCGIEAHICVAQTALTAVENYNVHLIADAAGSRAQGNWNVAVGRLHSAGAVITSTEMVIYELLKQAGTDEFRATLPLVK